MPGATESEAQTVCAGTVVSFLHSYLDAKEAGATEAQIAERIDAPPAALAILRRFVHAEYAGDAEAAKVALNELFASCVADLMYPKMEV